MPRTRTPEPEPAEAEVADRFPDNPLAKFIEVFHEDWQALSLANKLAKIAGAMGNVPKKGWNPNQKYKFVQETDLVAAVRPYLTAAGILLTFSVTEHEIIPRSNPDAKGLLTRVRLHYTATDGKEVIAGDMDGYGMDAGDKGVYKAITGAKKYVLTTLFLIDTGDDPEADTKTDQMTAEPTRVSDIASRVIPPHPIAPRQAQPPLFDERPVVPPGMESRDPAYYGEHGEPDGPPVVSPLRRTDVVRGGHTTGATDIQKERFIEAVRIKGWGGRQLLSFIRREFGAALVDAPEDDPIRLRGYITELLDSLSPADMGTLLVGIERED